MGIKKPARAEGGVGATWATAAPTGTSDPGADRVQPGSTELPSPEERFTDHGLVGKGGMGEVRLLDDAALGRRLVRKEIRPDRASSPGLRQRFLTEARITAQLGHPGVVPVHDVGILPDGRPYYTMREVKGVTLREAIGAVHHGLPVPGFSSAASDHASGLRRLLEAVLRAAETVAYAHDRGVIHRDLKPDNVMLGEFGAVLVLDWGLARVLAEADDVLGATSSGPQLSGSGPLTLAGGALGTPGYMPPEQARGELDAVGPWSDVFALGCVLAEALTGRPAYTGSGHDQLRAAIEGQEACIEGVGDPELEALCRWATALRPEARPPNAAALVDALSSWLAGARRRERALLAVDRATQHRRAWQDARARAAVLQGEAAAILAPLATYAPAEQKAPGWRKEDEAAELLARAELEAARFLRELHGALQVEPELPEAHAHLAAWHRQEHEAAEAAGDRGAALRAEELLRTHDRGEHAAWLAGTAVLRIETTPELARARLSRFVPRDRRLEPELLAELDADDLREVVLPAGSYLLELEAEGCVPVRYPVLLQRGGAWDEAPVWLPPLGSLASDDRYIPAGPFSAGGDPLAADFLPARRVHVDGFVLKAHPVTNQEYLAFLNDLVAQGRREEAERWAPRSFRGEGQQRQGCFGRTVAGGFALSAGPVEEPWLSRGPVVAIDWHSATAYAAWRAQQEGLPWRLPHSLEWEKAARGVDRRFLPWGDHFESTWACTMDAINGPPRPVSVDDYPLDLSLYGVRGLVGNVRDWCSDAYKRAGPTSTQDDGLDGDPAGDPGTWRMMKGGAAWNRGALVRPATRFASKQDVAVDGVGFRLARSIAEP